MHLLWRCRSNVVLDGLFYYSPFFRVMHQLWRPHYRVYPNGTGWLWTARKVVNQGNYGWCCGGLAVSGKLNQPSERLLSVAGWLHRQANIDGVLVYTSKSLGSWPGNCIYIVAIEDFLKTKNI